MKHTSEDAKSLLKYFFRDMHLWGLEAIKSFKPESKDANEILDNLNRQLILIYDKYAIPRERKTGRIEVMKISLGNPDYDPSNESIEEIQEVKSGFDVKTKKKYPDDDGYFETYKYKLKSTKDGLLIDSRERYSDYEKKWVKDIL